MVPFVSWFKSGASAPSAVLPASALAMDYLVNKFNEENNDSITVEAVYQGEYDDTINKLKSAQIGNMGADLVQIYDIGTRFMIDSGWVIPMQELIDADGYDISQIEPNIAAFSNISLL